MLNKILIKNVRQKMENSFEWECKLEINCSDCPAHKKENIRFSACGIEETMYQLIYSLFFDETKKVK